MGYQTRNNFWFGTERRSEWFRSPLRNYEASPETYSEGGTLINGGGYQFDAWGSHKMYQFEWGSATPVEWAQKLKCYADGTNGRGLIYFHEPVAYTRNVLPARWADPSMALNYEGSGLVYNLDPTAEETALYSPWATQQTNLNTNPSFEATSGTVEVYRNAFPNPAPVGVAGWAAQTGWTQADSGTHLTYLKVGAGATTQLGGSGQTVASLASLSAGTIYQFSIEVRPSVDTQMRALANYRNTGGQVGSVTGATVLAPAGVWTTLPVNGGIAPAGTTHGGTRASAVLSVADGVTIDVRRMLVSTYTGPYFDGANPIADPDLTTAWAGAANASATTVTGLGITGVSGGVGRSVVSSTQWAEAGTRSLRVVPGPLAVSGAVVGPVLTPGMTYTAVATGRLAAPLGTPSSDPFARTLYYPSASGQKSNQIPNVAGASVVRLTFTVDGAETNLRLGGDTGGNVYWDNFLLVEGVYNGPYFDGSFLDSDLVRYEWTGAANASTSIYQTRVREPNNYPLESAKYNLSSIAPGWRGREDAVFVPIPEGYTLFLGAAYSSTGTGGVFYLPSNRGELGVPTRIVPNDPAGDSVASSYLSASESISGVWLYVGKSSSGASSVTISGMSARLVETDKAFVSPGGPGYGLIDYGGGPYGGITDFAKALIAGPWVGGMGNSGTRFVGKPTYAFTGPLDGGQVGFAASFREVGDFSW